MLVSETAIDDHDATCVTEGPPYAEIERCDLPRAGELILSGWAFGLDRDEIAKVEVLLDGELVGQFGSGPMAFEDRPDLRDRLAELGLVAPGPRPGSRRRSKQETVPLPCGWRCRCEIPEVLDMSEARLLVQVRSASGQSRVVYEGGLEHGLALVTVKAMRRYTDRVEELEEIIELMKQSFFWRLRTRWFWVKRKLGLTDEY